MCSDTKVDESVIPLPRGEVSIVLFSKWKYKSFRLHSHTSQLLGNFTLQSSQRGSIVLFHVLIPPFVMNSSKKNKKNKCWTTQPDAQHFRYDVAAAAPQRHTPTQYSIRQEDGGRLPEVKNRRLKDIRAGYSSRRPVALNERALVETEHSHGDNLFEPLGKWRPAIKNAWMSGGTLSLRC